MEALRVVADGSRKVEVCHPRNIDTMTISNGTGCGDMEYTNHPNCEH